MNCCYMYAINTHVAVPIPLLSASLGGLLFNLAHKYCNSSMSMRLVLQWGNVKLSPPLHLLEGLDL